jgi:hypothetical protein
MAAYYRQNGVEPPRRYREPDATPAVPQAPPPVKTTAYELDTSNLTESEREMLAFAAELAATRGEWEPAAKLEREQQIARGKEYAEQQRKNNQYAEELRNTKRMYSDVASTHPDNRKANTVTHKEDILAALYAGRAALVDSAAAQIQRAVELMDEAKGMLDIAGQSITESTGYVAQAYQESRLTTTLMALNADRETVAGTVAVAREEVSGLLTGASSVVTAFDETIDREMRIGQ